MFKLPLFGSIGRRNDVTGRPESRPPQPFSGRTLDKHSRLRGATKVDSVCPYCAVGCGTNVYVKGGEVIDIEGNPHSPINEGTLCPKGANTFQLHHNPHRVKHAMYRAPYSDRWERVPLAWAMERIAQRVKKNARRGVQGEGRQGELPQRRHEHGFARRGDAGQRRELPHQEALQRRPARRVDREPGADMTSRLGARSGRHLRSRRGYREPAGPGQLRLRPHHGQQHGRGPPRGLPLADEGEGEGREADPRRPAV